MIGTILFLRLLLAAILVLIVYRFISRAWRRISPGKPSRGGKGRNGKVVEEMKKDPICGIYIPQSQAFSHRQGKKTYFFCSKNCLEAYKQAGNKSKE